MNKDLEKLKSDVARLEKKIASMANEGFDQQKKLAANLEQLTVAAVEAHEREKKYLNDKLANHINANLLLIGQIDIRDAEIAELKKGKT